MKENQKDRITQEFPEDSPDTDEPKKKKKARTAAEDLEYCRYAADPEHERAYREEEPCDDARAGEYEKTNRK
jgi:hypothetical protein